MRARVSRLRPVVVTLCLAASIGASVFAARTALRVERRLDSYGTRLGAVDGDLQALGRRADLRIVSLDRAVQAVRHPLHAALAWPAAGAVTDGFGGVSGRWHDGLDVDAPDGSPVRPAAAGVVVAAGWYEAYGNRVVVEHGRGLATVYAHLDSILIPEGALVTQGSVLGTVGCTGRCTGTHLHFEVRLNGSPTDPLLWLPPSPAPAAELHWAG